MVAIAFVAVVLGSCACAPRRPTPTAACVRTLPLLVAFDEDAFSFAAEFVAAAQPWTDALGRPVLRLARESEIPDYIVMTGPRPAEHPTWIASTRSRCLADGLFVLETTFYRHGDAAEDYRVAMHEIGHALGLDHSASKASIMYPNVDERSSQWVLAPDAVIARASNPR